jgi:hypothetical protein
MKAKQILIVQHGCLVNGIQSRCVSIILIEKKKRKKKKNVCYEQSGQA